MTDVRGCRGSFVRFASIKRQSRTPTDPGGGECAVIGRGTQGDGEIVVSDVTTETPGAWLQGRRFGILEYGAASITLEIL